MDPKPPHVSPQIGDEKQLTKKLLQDANQIMSDLQNIYYWYACGKLDESVFTQKVAAAAEAGPSGTFRPRQGRQAEALPAAVMTPREMAAARKQPRTSLMANQAQPKAPTEPLVKIEVELVTPDESQTTSLSDFRHPEYSPPFEQVLDNIIRQHGNTSTPLSKIFHLVYREEVQDLGAPGGKSFRIKWNATVMLCYCPFKHGKETIEEVNKCFLEGQELLGYGDGCTYWHGKLVPGTRIGKIQWLESSSVIQAVLEATTERTSSSSVMQNKEKLASSMGRVVTRWFFNSRTLISGVLNPNLSA